MNSTITSTYTNCYICEIYITEREHSLMIDVYHDIRKMFLNGKYNIYRQNHDLFTNIYTQFSSQCCKRKSFISFSIRKMIYDAISQWHPKWNQKNTYKTIQDKLFTKDIINTFRKCNKQILLSL